METEGRFCVCGQPIRHKNKGAKFCSDKCRKKAYDDSRTLERPFLALDGEGIGNRYVLLAAKLPGKESAYIYDREGLGTAECLDFLLGLSQGRKAGVRPIFCWFAFDYDVNMILGDIPLKGEEASIQQLRAENSTYWNGYKVTYIPRKIFKIRKNGRRFHSTDIFSFFQTSFENALRDWKIEVPEIITRGKIARQDFSTWSEEDICAYNDAELDCMAELAERLRGSVTPLGLPIRSWHGPGSLAGSWLSKQKAKHYKGEPPEEVTAAATRAYFGGRIDVQGYGFVSPVYHYDITSAYPSSIRYLPDLSNLEWIRTEGERPPMAGVSVARIRWNIPDTKTEWGAFPWRNRNGIIRYPLSGEGWYWQDEIAAAIERFGEGSFDFLESWQTVGDIHYPFLNPVEEAFAYRRELKREGKSSHIAVKLILNSLYGKFAQTVGRAQYYSPVWAGLITSHTRAQLQRAISPDVVCVMTDSIWTKKPIDLDVSGNLGAWEEQEEGTLILAGAGLYEAQKPDGSTERWQRGFDKRKPLDIEGIVSHWLGSNPLFEGRYSIKRFVGMGLASVTSHPWREWVELERTVKPVPFVGTTKRMPLYPMGSKDEAFSDFQPLRLRPADSDDCSAPYSKLILDEELMVRRLANEVAA